MTDIVPSDYAATLEHLKTLVHQSRYAAQRKVNTELLRLYWQIGNTLNDRQRTAAWGANVVGQLADDLRAEFPSMRGFSRANLFYMRRVAQAWPDVDLFVQQAAGQIPWTHLTLVLDKVNDPKLRDWYAAKSIAHGWSRAVLGHQIATNLHEREAAAPTNYATTLERADSELAQEITKDPYSLGFLAVDSDINETELEARLVERILETLRELGPGDWDAAESKLALLV
jgi:predicted nuclease of restriction endonuclease-like (RecB) superfamily